MRLSVRTLCLLSLLGLVRAIKVISTAADLPLAKDGVAEILNSSLAGQDEVTVCLRFLTHQFSVQHGEWIAVLSIGEATLFSRNDNIHSSLCCHLRLDLGLISN